MAQQLGSGSSGHATQSVVQGVRRRAVVLMLGLVLSEYHCLLTFVARRRGRILEIADLDHCSLAFVARRRVRISDLRTWMHQLALVASAWIGH